MGMTFSSGSCGGYTKPVKYAEAVVNCKTPGVCVCLLGGVCFGLLNYKLFRIADLVNKILPLYILKKKNWTDKRTRNHEGKRQGR